MKTSIKSGLAYFSLLFFLFIKENSGFTQNMNYARLVIDTLCSEHFHGRGYVNKGDSLAADYIKNEFIRLGLKPFEKGWLQAFPIQVNTFPSVLTLKAGGKSLVPGEDFMVSSSSPTLKGTFKTFYIDSTNASTVKDFKKILLKDLSSKIVVIDTKGINDKDILTLLNILKSDNIFKSKALVYISDKKLMWGIAESQEVTKWAVFYVQRRALVKKESKISVDIVTKYFSSYTTNNVAGYIPGKSKPDSFVVFTAHYDHLGQMGSTVYFPGANDNASGVAMLLNLASYYALPENTPEFSIVFIATSAEEVGLLGADYFSKNPLFSLKKTRFLINFDMVGTGDDGIKVVNATIFEKEFNALDSINTSELLLKTIAKRGEAAISDHYPFYAKGVPCFYIYTLGGISEYHNTKDISKTLPLTEFSDLFKLTVGFVKTLE